MGLPLSESARVAYALEPGEALELLDRERCSVYYGMANMARAMLEQPDRPRRRLDSMRTGLSVGLAEDIEVDGQGLVHAMNDPGLGAAIDFQLIERRKVAVLA